MIFLQYFNFYPENYLLYYNAGAAKICSIEHTRIS